MRFFLLILAILVAHNVYPQCSNTFRLLLKGTGNESASDLRQLPGGDIIIGGQTSSYGAGANDLFVTRMTKNGQIVWSKTYGGSNNEQFRRLRLSRDGDILVVAQTGSYGKGGGEAVAMRIAPDGTPRWSRKFSDVNETSLGLDIYSTADNGVVVSGVGYGSGGFSDWQIVKLDALGNIQWTKRLDYQTAEGAYSVIQKRDTLIFTGDSRAPNDYTCIISKMSVVDGTIYSTRSYTMDNRGAFSSNIDYSSGEYRINVHILNGADYTTKADGFIILDTASLAPKKTFKINPAAGNNSGFFTGFYQTADGGYVYTTSPWTSNAGYLYKFDQQSNLVYTRRFTASSTFICYSVMEDSDGAIWVTGSENSEAVVIKVDADGNFENCTNDPIVGTTAPTTFVETPFTWTREDVYTFNNISFTPTVRDITFQIDSLCKAPTCGTIELTGPQAICNLADSATYVAAKTGMCATNLLWTLPAGVSSRMVNDSTVRLVFPAAGTYMIIAENSIACSVLRDTVTVTVAPSPHSINLGNDTLICSANPLVLDAGAGFSRYLWQNNSTGQTLTVNASGTYYVTAWNLCNEQFSDTIVVNYRQPADFTVTPQDTAYCVALGPIQFLASGGHTYQWTPATYLNDPQIANPVGTPTASIQYMVTITDTVCHLSRDLPVNVTVTPSPRSINLGNDTLLCNAGTLVLDAGAGFTRYQWQDNSTAQTLSVSTSGTYYVKAWNNCNEEFTDTILVSYRLPTDFTVTPMDTTYCTPLAPIQFTATGGHLYQWTPATYLNDPQISNPVGMPTSSINYTVTITDTVCNRTQDLNVRVAVTPSPSLNLGNDTLLCNASTLVLNAGAGFARYQWQDNSTAQTLSVSTSGTYYVRTWNSCNEEFTDTIVVSYRLPTDFAVTPMDTTYCTPLAPIQFTATGGHLYQWTPATYLNNAQISNPVGMPTSSINYTVTITDTVCNRTQDLNVRVAVTPSPSLNLGSDTVLCNAGTLILDAGAGFTRYQWQDNSTSQTHTLTTAGTYYVNAWNSCNEELSDTVQVSYRLPNFSVTPVDTAYCTATNPIRFSASGGQIYRWSPSTYLNNAQISNPVGTPDASILYNVTITDTVCNRTRDLSVNITVNETPDLVLSKSNDINCSVAVTQLLVTGASHYEWVPDASLSALNIPNPIAKPDRTTTYKVRGFSDLGCETIDSITVNFDQVGISTIQLPGAFTPNADGRNDIFRVIAAGTVQVKEFSIFNRWGELIFTSNSGAKGWDGRYKGVMQESGAYYWFVKAVSPCGGDLFKKGSVILIR